MQIVSRIALVVSVICLLFTSAGYGQVKTETGPDFESVEARWRLCKWVSRYWMPDGYQGEDQATLAKCLRIVQCKSKWRKEKNGDGFYVAEPACSKVRRMRDAFVESYQSSARYYERVVRWHASRYRNSSLGVDFKLEMADKNRKSRYSQYEDWMFHDYKKESWGSLQQLVFSLNQEEFAKLPKGQRQGSISREERKKPQKKEAQPKKQPFNPCVLLGNCASQIPDYSRWDQRGGCGGRLAKAPEPGGVYHECSGKNVPVCNSNGRGQWASCTCVYDPSCP